MYRRFRAVSVSTLLLFACKSESGGPAVETFTLAVLRGADQSAVAGTAVATPPAVRLINGSGSPVSGRTVAFAVVSGGGTLTGASQTTDANGVAAVGSWMLGATAGGNSITATAAGNGVTGNPVTISATGTAGPPANLSRQAGDAQTAVAGQAVTTRPSVKVTDANGNGVSGVVVTFAVAGGGGTVSGAQQTTDASGVATVGGWTLGTTRGENRLNATAAGTTVVATFVATGISGPAALVTKSAGDGQSAAVASAVSTRPAVRVTDVNGNPVAGVAVTFAVTAGGGSITGATQTTDANGNAAVESWTLGTTLVENALSATVAGSGLTGNPARFTATATAGPPAALAKHAGDVQQGVAGQAVAVKPAVRITDARGNPVSGVAVTFAVSAGGGSLTGAQATTDANGVATVGSWILGNAAGGNALSATIAGQGINGNPASFAATGVAGPPAIMTKSAGDAQSAIAGQAVAVAPAIRVTDVNGNAVANVAVTFAVVTGGGTVTGAAQVTNASGIATVGSWTLGNAAGGNSLSATVATTGIAGNPATFTATGAIDPAAFAGNWTGGWQNTTFGSSGSATLVMTVNTTTRTVSFVLDLNGNVFGQPDPPAETFNGTYAPGGGFTVSGPSTLFGAFTLTVSASGAVTAAGLNPQPGISRIDFTGTANPNTIAVNYTIAFTGGGGAVGTLTLNKP